MTKRFTPVQAELEALKRVAQILERLSEPERKRVLAYMLSIKDNLSEPKTRCAVCGSPEADPYGRHDCDTGMGVVNDHTADNNGSELNVLENTDRILRTHRKSKCAGAPCTIHNRSQHHMRSWPQHWRADLNFMERTCEHGIGHPDPDEKRTSKIRLVHGCDGCCTPPKKVWAPTDVPK